MKRISIYVLLACAFIALSASKKTNLNENFVSFDNNLLVSKYEVSNKDFKNYLNYLKLNGDLENYNKVYPDTSNWMDNFTFSYNEPYKNMYFWHPSYNNYPLVNITKSTVDKYCIWLSEEYNTNEKRQYKKVIFRLPTEKEWMRFSSALPGHTLPWYGNYPYVLDKKDCTEFLANIKVKDYTRDGHDYVADGGMITVALGSYKPNKLGLYDIIGNVAELTSDGKLKGGSWDNTIEECMINKTQDYEISDPRVGFRLVMEVIEK